LKSITEIITGPILAEQAPEELPRQNPERENAVVGAQGVGKNCKIEIDD